jgi:hypothetical protein
MQHLKVHVIGCHFVESFVVTSYSELLRFPNSSSDSAIGNSVRTDLGDFHSSAALLRPWDSKFILGWMHELKPLSMYGKYKIYNYCSLFLRRCTVYHTAHWPRYASIRNVHHSSSQPPHHHSPFLSPLTSSLSPVKKFILFDEVKKTV